MEWTELQVLWQQYDAHLAENTRINKEILKRMIRKNPERRLKWMRFWAIYGMVMPIPIVCVALIPSIKFRNEWDFYFGLFLLVIMLANVLYKTTQEFLLIRDINFTNQITKTRKQLVQLKELKLEGIKWGFLFLFVAGIGVSMLEKIPVMIFIKFTIFIFLIAIVANYIHFKRFKNQMNSFNAELDEIEQLERE